MGRWDKKHITGESTIPTPNELDQLKRLNDRALIDIDEYDKLSGDGEIERLNNVRQFIQNPQEMRKHLRKKKSVKPKSKRKSKKGCKCK